MTELEKYKQLLKSKGKKFSKIAIDEEGYFHPDLAFRAAKAKKEQSTEKKKIKKEESGIMSEALELGMQPLGQGQDVGRKKTYTDLVMKRLKRISPRM